MAWGTVNIRGQLDKPKRFLEGSGTRFDPDVFFDPTRAIGRKKLQEVATIGCADTAAPGRPFRIFTLSSP
jgi:hypothetical protein